MDLAFELADGVVDAVSMSASAIPRVKERGKRGPCSFRALWLARRRDEGPVGRFIRFAHRTFEAPQRCATCARTHGFRS
jgi:hypothetical protein